MRKLLILALLCLVSQACADEVLDRLLEYQSKSTNLSYALDDCVREKSLMTVNASDYYLRYLDCSAVLEGFDLVLNGSEGNLSECRAWAANLSDAFLSCNGSFQNVSSERDNLSLVFYNLSEDLRSCRDERAARELDSVYARAYVLNASIVVDSALYNLTVCRREIDTTCPNMRDAMLVYYPKWKGLSSSARDCLPKMMLVGGFQNLEAISQACNIAKQSTVFGSAYSPEAMNLVMEYNSAGLLEQQNISGEIYYQVKNFGGGCIAAFKDKERETGDLTDKAFITDSIMWNAVWIMACSVVLVWRYFHKRKKKRAPSVVG